MWYLQETTLREHRRDLLRDVERERVVRSFERPRRPGLLARLLHISRAPLSAPVIERAEPRT